MADIDRRAFLQRGAGAAAALALGSGAGLAQAQRPNFLLIITDDQNPDTLGCWGGQALTPRIDALAARGVKLMNNYAHCALCSASRYTCMTGRYVDSSREPSFLRRYPPGTQTNVGWDTRSRPIRRLSRIRCNAPATAPVSAASGMSAGRRKGIAPGHRRGLPGPDDAASTAAGARVDAGGHQGPRLRLRRLDLLGNTEDYKLGLVQRPQPGVDRRRRPALPRPHGREPFFLYVAPTIHHGPSPQLHSRPIAYHPRGYLDQARKSSRRARRCSNASRPPGCPSNGRSAPGSMTGWARCSTNSRPWVSPTTR